VRSGEQARLLSCPGLAGRQSWVYGPLSPSRAQPPAPGPWPSPEDAACSFFTQQVFPGNNQIMSFTLKPSRPQKGVQTPASPGSLTPSLQTHPTRPPPLLFPWPDHDYPEAGSFL
jgi:hypothetical protein